MKSFTSVVPPDVPSLFQRSLPWMPSLAMKNRSSPSATGRGMKTEPFVVSAGLTSFTRTVLDSVPSLFQSSWPCTGSEASNSTVPFSSRMSSICDPADPGLMSLRRVVPASEPSLRQSSRQ